jgi:membrane-associated phospholipid phosphatase
MEMRERLARLISNTLNPFVVSAVIIILLAFSETSGILEALKWASISLAVSVLPTLIIVIYLVRSKRMEGFFNTTREQRNVVYLFASGLGDIGCGLLWQLNAPEMLAVTFTAGLISIVLFMGINYYWKVSLHTAFIVASLTIAIIVYGAEAAWAVIFLPSVAWARIELKQHSIAQVVVGSLLVALVVAGIFWGFGVIGK